MNDTKDKLLEAIQKYDLISRSDKIIVGVSGGPDSMALLSLLLEIKDEMKLKIHVAHLNHMNRGDLSFQDMEYVKEFCRANRIPCDVVVKDIVETAKLQGRSFEEVGREARYELFEVLVKRLGFNKIAVAHNQNDQAETMLFRLIRGSGIDGLKSMSPKRGRIIRPLMDISRSEIEEYCEYRNLNPRHDETNDELIHDRNIIRNVLIPMIEKDLNPNVISTLSNSAKILAFDSDYLLVHSRKILAKLFKTELPIDLMTGEEMTAPLTEFNMLHYSVKSRIVRTLAECINGNIKDLTSKMVNETIRVLNESKHGNETSLGNARFKMQYDKLIVSRSDESNLTYDVAQDYEIEVEVIDKSEFEEGFKPDRTTIIIDFEKVKGDLHIRKRKDGDRFKPFGMVGTKKLKNYMIDEKVPVRERERIPLLCDGEDIVWVYGYRLSEDYKVTGSTKKIAKIKLKPRTSNVVVNI